MVGDLVWLIVVGSLGIAVIVWAAIADWRIQEQRRGDEESQR